MVRFDLIYHSSRIWAFLPKSMKSGASICLCLSTAEEHELTPSNGISSSLNIFDEPLSEKSNSSHFLFPLLPCMWLYMLSSKAHSLLSVSFKIWAIHVVPHPPWPCFGSHVFVYLYIFIFIQMWHLILSTAGLPGPEERKPITSLILDIVLVYSVPNLMLPFSLAHLMQTNANSSVSLEDWLVVERVGWVFHKLVRHDQDQLFFKSSVFTSLVLGFISPLF